MNKIILDLNGKTYVLAGISVNAYNRNSGNDPYPGDNTMIVQMKAAKADQSLWDWFYNVIGDKRSGSITVFREEDIPVFSIKFTDGYSYGFNANAYAQDNYGNELSITLVASSISIQALSATGPGKPQV